MATLLNTDPNITYADWLQSGSANGTGITSTVKTIADGKGTSTALGLSTTQVNCANVTFNGNTINTTSGTILVPANITFSGTVTGAGSVPSLTNTHVFVGNSSNVATDVAVSGDATLANTGALTLSTVNSNIGSYAVATVTVNGKGLVTAASAASTTGSGNVVLATSPSLTTPLLGTPTSGNLSNCTSTSMIMTTPVLGTPTSGTLTNCTGLPVSTGVSGLGTGVATFLSTPTSANLAAAMTNETGSGALVFATSPTLVTPVLGAATASTLNLGDTTLDTYIANTWSPTDNSITFSGGGTAVWSASYTRIGRIVLCTATLTNSLGSPATSTCVNGVGSITNLPVANTGTWAVNVIDQGAGTVLGQGILNGVGAIYPPSWTTKIAVCFTFYYLAGSD